MPESEVMVPVDGAENMFKTLVLLEMDFSDGPVYFVVEGIAIFDSIDKMNENEQYFYEEHTCPTNFMHGVVCFFDGDNDDPHGLFKHVQTVWMTQEYLERKARNAEVGYLRKVFPQITQNKALNA